MKEMIEELKSERDKLEKAKEEYNIALDDFKIAHQDLIQDMENSKLGVIALCNEISKAALKEYADTGNKKLYGGIGIRVMSKLDYDEVHAFNWARQHNLVLKLDMRAFENFAKAEDLDFVTTVNVPKATIPVKL